LGFDPSPNTMKSADIVFMSYFNSSVPALAAPVPGSYTPFNAYAFHTNPGAQWVIDDRYALDVGIPVFDTATAQARTGGKDDLTNKAASRDPDTGISTFSWSRKKVTGDPWDHDLHEGMTRIMFAFNPLTYV
jgi:hypothetical protein